jgi:hypothetical protein
VSAAREALASALESAIEAWSDGDHYNAPAGAELLERLLGSEPGRRALVDVAAELGLDQLADALIGIAGSLQQVFESAVGVLRYGAGSEHPAGPNPPAAGEHERAFDAMTNLEMAAHLAEAHGVGGAWLDDPVTLDAAADHALAERMMGRHRDAHGAGPDARPPGEVTP